MTSPPTSDARLFRAQLLRKPWQVVALAPSSPALAAEMVAEIDPQGGPVIELGAGTGVFTEALLELGVPPGQLHCLEINPDFCARLRERFAGVAVHQRSAGEIGSLPVDGVQAVVSGLPYISMPYPLRRAILDGAMARMHPQGQLVQFTYGLLPPVSSRLRALHDLQYRASQRIWSNLPPARVYRFFRAPA